jgi:hypothetical protein
VSVASCANSDVQLVVSEMKSFINDLDTSYTGSAADNDLTAFWHRKTGKPVLGIFSFNNFTLTPIKTQAVLLARKPGADAKLYRGKSQYCTPQLNGFVGLNMEVSMPTGSLCGDKN